MLDLEAGPELDRKVAGAIGATSVGDGMVGLRYGPVYELDGEQFSLFSEDLNMAMAAAEKAGFFKWLPEQGFVLGWRDSEQWAVWDEFEPSDSYSGETPALAVCAAILGLKED